MSLRERAAAYAAQMEADYLVREAERIEAESDGLRALLAAVVLGNGEPITLSHALMDAAGEFSIQLQAQPDALVVGLQLQEERAESPATVLPPPEPVLGAPRPGGDAPEAPSEPLESLPDVETIDEDTPEAREERYLARHTGGTPVAKPASRLRPWDKPEDLQWHDTGNEQPERHSGELSHGVGEGVSVTIG